MQPNAIDGSAKGLTPGAALAIAAVSACAPSLITGEAALPLYDVPNGDPPGATRLVFAVERGSQWRFAGLIERFLQGSGADDHLFYVNDLGHRVTNLAEADLVEMSSDAGGIFGEPVDVCLFFDGAASSFWRREIRPAGARTPEFAEVHSRAIPLTVGRQSIGQVISAPDLIEVFKREYPWAVDPRIASLDDVGRVLTQEIDAGTLQHRELPARRDPTTRRQYAVALLRHAARVCRYPDLPANHWRTLGALDAICLLQRSWSSGDAWLQGVTESVSELRRKVESRELRVGRVVEATLSGLVQSFTTDSSEDRDHSLADETGQLVAWAKELIRTATESAAQPMPRGIEDAMRAWGLLDAIMACRPPLTAKAAPTASVVRSIISRRYWAASHNDAELPETNPSLAASWLPRTAAGLADVLGLAVRPDWPAATAIPAMTTMWQSIDDLIKSGSVDDLAVARVRAQTLEWFAFQVSQHTSETTWEYQTAISYSGIADWVAGEHDDTTLTERREQWVGVLAEALERAREMAVQGPDGPSRASTDGLGAA